MSLKNHKNKKNKKNNTIQQKCLVYKNKIKNKIKGMQNNF